MKTLASTIALCILVVSVFPCCTLDDCFQDESKVGQTAEATGNQCGASELCSPLFRCQACTGSGQTVEIFTLTSAMSLLSGDLPTATLFPSLQFPHSIWHPPKIG